MHAEHENRERQAAGSHSYKKWVKKKTHHKFHFSYKLFLVHTTDDTNGIVCVCMPQYDQSDPCALCTYVCERASEFVCVLESDKLKIINNHVNEQEKEGEHIEWQAERIILCLLYFNSEKQTQYYDICGLSVVVVVLLFIIKNHIAFFLVCVLNTVNGDVWCWCFCCFSFCR